MDRTALGIWGLGFLWDLELGTWSFFMILEQFIQDIRVGLRVLFKDKVFLVLSIVVLGLGIGGAMTQFAVVNAIVLRGFSITPNDLA
ncbi:MAG: hypothetical protein M3119_07105 [Verrucomicrobiota bacterium]|nr:hypothetical protein [Verrucomicrobiota bacterium]MDQ6939911.1 hypothetical protein [Verrucomicrobiota bacterium]